MSVDETIASANLQNPSDALEILAHVADRAGGNNVQKHTGEIHNQHTYPTSATNMLSPHDRLLIPSMNGTVSNVIQFPPLINGLMTFDMMRDLIKRYETCYHTFFPLANQAIFDTRNLPMIAKTEPHLLAAILTVASKDDAAWWQVHEACSLHMQQLVSALVYSGSGGVEAVEALLILGEWVPRRYQSTATIGRGEEDHAAWMHVGTALRLGYLLGLDRTAFRSESDAYSSELSRKRLAWAACYISDRHVSVRIGKGFWSRGPGPMTGLRAGDFPSLQRKTPQDDDLAAILQANLELTQLFSNAHDVLYSAKSQQYQQTLGGEYVKYIDDFRSPHLKSSLILSYEYLRLYVNAFAYQATMNRMVAQSNAAAGQRHPNAAFTEVAAMPDARFIYDSIDAAKSLLSIFNSFVDPVACFRFMPLRFYLYVIYSTVFLYKARATGVMGADNRGGVLRMINDTIDRLQKASACPNDLGDRYSRLIRLLWRKPPSGPGVPENNTTQPVASNTHNSSLSSDRSEHQQMIYDAFNNPTSINAFSWLDLEAVGDFATNNNSISGSLLDGLDDTIGDGFDPFDVNVGTNEYFWPGDTTQGIIF
ncbi:hypothetical protein LTR04_002691 [Oleoguttula sp. CCFEE 6159]|nr:hypothetical protein LTR04_002691 [Oleoguttula sp. CCFEE 6159]